MFTIFHSVNDCRAIAEIANKFVEGPR